MRLFYVFFLITGVAFAALSPQQQARLHAIEDSLNRRFNNVAAEFTQRNPNGTIFHGRLYLKRPGHMRLEYEKKAKMLIIADGNALIHKDLSLDSVNTYPLESGPAGLLLKKKIDLQKDVEILDMTTMDDITTLVVQGRDDTTGATISLTFCGPLCLLSGWKIETSDGDVTEMTLYEVKLDQKLSAGLFRA